MIYKKLLTITCLLCLAFFFMSKNELRANEDVSETPDEIEYSQPTFENFAKTYWRFNKFDPEDKAAVDNYMMINECDLYTEYYYNEFEWAGIQKATKEFLMDNMEKFPDNYEFVQSISLGDFDFERGGFNIVEENLLEAVKRFEIPSDAYNKSVCGYRVPIPGYPRVIALELTRPLTFTFFKMDEALAREILAEKMQEFEKLPPDRRSRKTYLEAREVYLKIKVKLFAYKPEDILTREGHYIAKMLGILEEIEVYSDRDMTQLMFRQDLRRKKRTKRTQL